MCPDRQILSLYLDGELPSPWKEKMESHLEACPECRAALAVYGIGKRMDNPNEESILAAQERVWKKLVTPALVVSENAGRRVVKQTSQRYAQQRIWNRNITLPLPAAAAAAVLIIIAMIAVMGLRDRNVGRIQDAMAVIPDYMQLVGNEQVMVPTTDMTSVLQYLSSMDNGGDFMVIRLPESKNFIHAGEPAFINAADYSRRRLPR